MIIPFIKLLDLANPKELKDTINNIITLCNTSNEVANGATQSAIDANTIAREARAMVESAFTTGALGTLVYDSDGAVLQIVEFCSAQDIDNLFN